VLVPNKTHSNTSKPFPNILSTREVQSSRFFQSSSFKQVLFLFYYNTQNLNPTHTFQYSRKSNNLAFFHHQKAYLHFLNMHQINSSSPHFLAETWSTKFMKSFHWVVEIVLHLINRLTKLPCHNMQSNKTHQKQKHSKCKKIGIVEMSCY
jgi:hypothetical protein